MGSPAYALVVGGSPEPSSGELLRCLAADAALACAVDRGFDALRAAGVPCRLFCGDADSISPEGAAALAAAVEAGALEQERYAPEKDATDLALALAAVRRRLPGCAVVATCLTGGRPDHFLGAMGCLAHASDPVCGTGEQICPDVRLVEDGFEARFLHAGASWELDGCEGRTFSFVPLADAVVSERGMHWELDRASVPLLSDLGVSNVIECSSAAISCHEGTVAAWLIA